MKQLILFFLSSYCIIGINSQERATLLFFGDIMGHDAQIQSASRNQGEYYDYSECFKWIEPYFRSVDLAIGNLELTFAGSPYGLSLIWLTRRAGHCSERGRCRYACNRQQSLLRQKEKRGRSNNRHLR